MTYALIWRYDPECHILTANAGKKKTQSKQVISMRFQVELLRQECWWETVWLSHISDKPERKEERTELTETKPESFFFGITGSILTFPNSPLFVFNKTLTCQSLRSVWTSKRHVNSLIFGSGPHFESGFGSRSGYRGIDVHSSFNHLTLNTEQSSSPSA